MREPQSMAWLFPEYDFAAMDPEIHVSVIIERVLDHGQWDEVRWLFENYGPSRVTDWVRQHGFRLLSKRSFALWRLVLEVTDYFAPEWVRAAKDMESW